MGMGNNVERIKSYHMREYRNLKGNDDKTPKGEVSQNPSIDFELFKVRRQVMESTGEIKSTVREVSEEHS